MDQDGNHEKKKITVLSIVQNVITIGLCFLINLIFSLLLYEPVMLLFDVNTDGFINLNGIFTLAIIWLVIAAIVFGIAKAIKEKLGSFYKTIRITQIVLFVLPFLILFLFLVMVNLK